jgi:alkylhydroperoxidase family enzyme
MLIIPELGRPIGCVQHDCPDCAQSVTRITDLQRQLQEAQRIVDAAVIWRDSTEDDDDADDALCIAVDAAIAGERTPSSPQGVEP